MLTLNDKSFDRYRTDDMPLLVMFKAVFAGPCNLAAPVFEEARNRRGNQVRFAFFDLDGNPKIPEKYGVRQLPLYMLFVDGEPVDVVAGAVPLERILEIVEDI